MNKKGFTLVELLAVIVIIGIVLVILVPNVIDLIDDRKQELYDSQVSEIEKAARSYIASNPDAISTTLPFNIELTTLCTDSYIDCPIINPIDKTNISGHVEVNIDLNQNYTYIFVIE